MKRQPSPFQQKIAALGRNIITALSSAAYTAGRFFARIPYRKAGGRIARLTGSIFHALLFKYLLPKKYRSLEKKEIYNIIFKSDTPAGKKFDIWLLVLIFFNLMLIIAESIPAVHKHLFIPVLVLQWCCTIVFTFEYYLRIYCLKHPWKYIFSFYGIIDFVSIFPAYLSILLPATSTLSVLRILRTLRIFRILKLQRFIDESNALITALKRSTYKILIFMFFVYITAVLLGSIVYMFENGHNPQFDSIPRGIYWAVVTLTTVGYGDMTPVTLAGRLISVIIMILGYSVIAVLTGIVTSETVQANKTAQDRQRTSGRPYGTRHAGPGTHTDTSAEKPSNAQPDLGVVNDEEEPNKSAQSNGTYADNAAATSDDQTNETAQEARQHNLPPKYCPHCGFEEPERDAVFCRMCGTRLQSDNTHNWINDFFGK